MARLTKELKSLVERQLVAKIQEIVGKANAVRQAAELDSENEMVASRNEVRQQLIDMGLPTLLKEGNRLIKSTKAFTPENTGKYHSYEPVIKCDNFSMEMEKPAKKNNKTYYSVSCTNSVGNISIHNTSLAYSGAASSSDEDSVTLVSDVTKVVDTYDKALVSVSLGGDIDEVRDMLAAYGVSF